MSKILVIGLSSIMMTMVLCGCPGKVNPGNSRDSALGKTSFFWGLPMVRTITAGFNGFPSEANGAGPANTTNPKKATP